MKRLRRWRLVGIVSLILVSGTLGWTSLGLGAYSSHQNDQDINNFLTAYPFARSTKLDDCVLCHPGGSITQGSKTTSYGSCDYCHLTYGLQAPHGNVPLNTYGQAYRDAGRNAGAVATIEPADSDGDSFTNLAEINALTLPGDSKDYPGLSAAPVVVMNLERILKLKGYSQFFLNNASKSADWYARYSGARMSDLLKQVGLRSEATQITVFAPDGFSKTFPIDAPDPQTPPNIQYDVMGSYSSGYYYGGLDFVEYGYDPGYPDGDKVPDKLYMLIGYMREGNPLAKGQLEPDPANPARLVLNGEGPYRLIVPQKVPGSPDRPSTATPLGDGWDYDANKDHNAGFSVRSMTAIRVEPLPAGTTDFTWTEGGWNLVDQGRLVIYGAISPHTYTISGKITDAGGNPVAGVKLSFALENLGRVGSTASDGKGKFKMALPLGEYVMIPSKEGYAFDPASVPFSLTEKGYKMDFVASPAP